MHSSRASLKVLITLMPLNVIFTINFSWKSWLTQTHIRLRECQLWGGEATQHFRRADYRVWVFRRKQLRSFRFIHSSDQLNGPDHRGTGALRSGERHLWSLIKIHFQNDSFDTASKFFSWSVNTHLTFHIGYLINKIRPHPVFSLTNLAKMSYCFLLEIYHLLKVLTKSNTQSPEIERKMFWQKPKVCRDKPQ